MLVIVYIYEAYIIERCRLLVENAMDLYSNLTFIQIQPLFKFGLLPTQLRFVF